MSSSVASRGTGEADEAELGRLTRLLPLAVIAAAVCLFASELMTIFDFGPVGGDAQCSQGAGDRHSNAQMVIAGFAVISTLIAVGGRSRPAAIATAAMGVLALLIFLVSDLRVAGTTGQLSEACGGFLLSAETIPQGGFYLELVGALALAVTGIALATLTPAQLGALRPAPRARTTEQRRDEPAEEPHQGDDQGAQEGGRLSRLTRRPRARQRG